MQTPSFPNVHLPMLENVPLPLLMQVRLPHPRGTPIVDIEGKIAQELAGAKKLNALPPGASVAVGIGSRGVAHIPRLARAVVAYLKEKGYEPFIVPTMGSHGGGVAEGQAGVLEELGVTEATVGAPVRATMDVVEFGTTSDGIPCCMDANAAAADGVVFVARVKAHTSFLRDIESGLCKMVGIGFGKAQGARNIHRLGPKGYCKVLPELAAIMAEKSPLVCGIGVVENGYDDITEIEAVEPENFQAADRRLLIEARKVHQKLPFKQMDAMIVEWIGKEISGSGMDPVVTGRYDFRDEYLTGWAEPAPDRPVVVKLGVLGVTPMTRGNAVGIGTADYTHNALIEGIDLYSMYFNGSTARLADQCKIPVVLPTERDVITMCAYASWRERSEDSRMVVIQSTMHLEEVLVSPSLFADIETMKGVEVLSDPAPIEFDADGRLVTRVSSRDAYKLHDEE